mgnify:CR=1 FL=1
MLQGPGSKGKKKQVRSPIFNVVALTSLIYLLDYFSWSFQVLV